MKRSPRARRLLLALAACLVIVGIAGFFVLPPLVKAQGEKRLTALLGRTVSIGNVRVNPYMLSVALEDVEVLEKDGRGSFFGWRRLYVRLDAIRSLAGEWVLGAIELDGFHAAVVVNSDGSFNFSDVIARLSAPPGAGPAPGMGRPIRIGSLGVTQARVGFSDNSLRHPFATVLGPLTFTLTDFRTSGGPGAPYQFLAETEAGERLMWRGTLSANPVESHGEFAIENLILAKYSPYIEGRVRANVTDGKLTLAGTYEANFDPSARVLALSNSEVHIRDLKVADRGTGDSAAEVKALDITAIQADAVALRASIGRIALTGGHVALRRYRDGSINLLTMLSPGASQGAQRTAGPGSAPAQAPQVAVGEVVARDLYVDVTDEALPHVARLSLGGIQFSLTGFSLADGATMPVRASFSWLPKGTVAVGGVVTLKPQLAADLKADVQALEMLPLSPYIEEFVNARITQGSFSTSASIRASTSDAVPELRFKGDLSIDRFGMVDAAHDKDLVGFARLDMTGVEAATLPRVSVSAREVDVSGPYARIRMDADGSLNISTLVRNAHPSPPDAAPASIVVGRVVINDGDFSFADESVEPDVQVSVAKFGGTLSGLSSETEGRADVDLRGMVGGAGPVEISGKVDPLGAHKFVSLKVDVRDVDLEPLSPYSGKYAGYALARGQLVVDSRILVDGAKVDASNVVTLNQFTFGSATSSRDATALPVRLAVALLKDNDGRIVIDLPVQGSLTDPEFRVGKVVLRVVVNLLTKVAVSPFSLVGSMFGGGGEELAFQEFIPGHSELQKSELSKLETIVKALANRPALNLGIEGGYDPAADTYALKRIKLAELIRSKVWEERHAANPNVPPPELIAVTPEENAAMVKRLFDLRFRPGTQFGAPLPPPPAVAPPPPGPQPGLLRRIVDAVTFKRQRDEDAARREAEQLSAERQRDVAKSVEAGPPLEEMTGRLADSTEVTASDLGEIAAARAQSVRDYLVQTGTIAASRLFLETSADPAARKNGPRVFLSLQ